MKSALVFEVGESLAAVPVDLVEEICDRAPLTPIPGAPAEVLGLLQHGGRMIPVIDVAARLGIGPSGSAAGQQGCVIVIQSEEHPMRRWCGLAVARVLGVRRPDDAEAQDLPFVDVHALLSGTGEGAAGAPLDKAPRDGACGIPPSTTRT